MSFCYADDNTIDSTSSQSSYLHVMPESPLQHKLSSNNTTTTNHIGYVHLKKQNKKKAFFTFPHVCACVCVD